MPLIKLSSTTLAPFTFQHRARLQRNPKRRAFLPHGIAHPCRRGASVTALSLLASRTQGDREEAVEPLRGSATSDITRAVPATAVRAAY